MSASPRLAEEFANYPLPWRVEHFHSERNGWEDHGVLIRAANHRVVMTWDDIRDQPPPDVLLFELCRAMNTRPAVAEAA